ncbi:MAG TPA: sulfatase-like hydrolase/transferase [Bryobacteraceae bacterium]|nr:sulfatase-like hydrolase/transferase [Bryobacteraceae bacterium]
MLRRTFLASTGVAAAQRSTRRKPNLLFLIADDHAGYVLGSDGDRIAETPHLDGLASEGTRFAANYCNSPVCTPSRQSFLTGQLPHAAGVTVLRTALDPSKPTTAKQLKAAGYTTAVFGKMHLNQPDSPGLFGFDSMMTEVSVVKAWRAAGGKPVPSDVRTQTVPWRPFATPAEEWLNAGNLPYPRYEQDMRSAFQLRQAESWLEQNKARQFALWMSFQEPHSPFDFPVEGRRFSADRFNAPQPGPEDAWQIPLIFRDLSPEQKQGIRAAYYNSVRYLDSNIGRMLDLLRRHRLEEDTLVVYMADHGYSLGQHGRFEKHCGYDPAMRVPLIFRLPGRVRQGVVNDLTESVDVPHTILDLLEAPPLPVQHGRSLRPWMEGGTNPRGRDHIFSEYLENEEAFIRTKTHKLIFCSGRRERTDGYKTDNPTPGRYTRLYDLAHDPDEFHDVAAKQPKVAEQLKRLMLDRFRGTHLDRAGEPSHGSVDELLEWYLRPRDSAPPERNL